MLDDVLVVDDGSADQDRRARARSRRGSDRSRAESGKGETIKTGLRHWLRCGRFDFVIILDADGQHRPEEIDRFVAAALVSGRTETGSSAIE